MSRSQIQKREALAIASKLKAKLTKDGPHQIATFEFAGKTILTFGIRHGNKGGHGHLTGRHGNLCLSETKAMKLATCTMSKDEYIQHLKDIGQIYNDTENLVQF